MLLDGNPENATAPLGLGALDRHEARGRAQGRFRKGFRVRFVILLALHKRLHVGRRDKPNLVAVPLCHPAPVTRRGAGAGLHRNDARGLLGEKRRQTRPRKTSLVLNYPLRPDGANLEATLRKVDRQHADIRR